MDQLVILVIIAVISLVNWLLQKSAEHKARREAEARIDRGGVGADDLEGEYGIEREVTARRASEQEAANPQDQYRRFMEALGLPPGEELPSPAFPRPVERVPPPLPEVPQPTRRRNFLHKVDADLEQRLVPTPTLVAPKPVVTRLADRRTARRERNALAAMPAPTAARGGVDLLKTPQGLRQAVIAREILGPCRGLEAI